MDFEGKEFLLIYRSKCANADLSTEACNILVENIEPLERGLIVGKTKRELGFFASFFKESKVEFVLLEDLEQSFLSQLPDEAKAILFESTDSMQQISFGHTRTDSQKRNWSEEDIYFTYGFKQPFESHLGSFCFNEDISWPQVLHNPIQKESDEQSFYANKYDFLVALSFPETLRQLHAMNFVCAKRRWAVIKGQEVSQNMMNYGLSLTTAKEWNPTGNTKLFSCGLEIEETYFPVLPDNPNVIVVEEEEEKSEPKKRRPHYFPQSGKKRRAHPSIAIFNEAVSKNFDSSNNYLMLHGMSRNAFDSEVEICRQSSFRRKRETRFENLRQYEFHKNFRVLSNNAARFSQIIAMMANDSERFAPNRTLIVTSHMDALNSFKSALSFLNGARIIVVTPDYLSTGFCHILSWNKISKYAYFVTPTDIVNTTMENAITNVSRVIVGDAFAGIASNGKILRVIRSQSPLHFATWTCYRYSYEHHLAEQFLRKSPNAKTVDFTNFSGPVCTSEYSPIIHDEERNRILFDNSHAKDSPKIHPAISSYFVETHDAALMNSTSFVYRIHSTKQAGTQWVALPVKMLIQLYKLLEKAFVLTTLVSGKRKLIAVRESEKAFDPHVIPSSGQTLLTTAPDVWPRSYEMVTLTQSKCEKKLPEKSNKQRAVCEENFEFRDIQEIVGELSVVRMRVKSGHLELDASWECPLDLELLWTMFRQRFNILQNHMPTLETQIMLVSQLCSDDNEARRNTLFLLALGCFHNFAITNPNMPNEIALLTQSNGLIGYTSVELVYETMFAVAYNSSSQQFVEFAPPYAKNELFRLVNQELPDRKICESHFHDNTGWSSFILDIKTDEEVSEQRNLLQKDQSSSIPESNLAASSSTTTNDY